jgi:hypothetical protein
MIKEYGKDTGMSNKKRIHLKKLKITSAGGSRYPKI